MDPSNLLLHKLFFEIWVMGVDISAFAKYRSLHFQGRRGGGGDKVALDSIFHAHWL